MSEDMMVLNPIGTDSSVFNTLALIAEADSYGMRTRLAAGIYKNGRPLSFGVNLRKSDPFQKRFTRHPEAIYIHAEIAAIKRGLKRISKKEMKRCSLVICRIKFDGPTNKKRKHNNLIYGMAKPCVGCMKAIRHFGIKEICYSTDKQTCIIERFDNDR